MKNNFFTSSMSNSKRKWCTQFPHLMLVPTVYQINNTIGQSNYQNRENMFLSDFLWLQLSLLMSLFHVFFFILPK